MSSAVANWSMSLLGFPAHARATAPMVAATHMSTFQAMRFAQAVGLGTGWLLASGDQPQLERLDAAQPTWVALTDLFASARVVATEGLSAGSLVLVGATAAAGQPPRVDGNQGLVAWADAHGLPWVEVVDNEVSWWGGLDEPRIAKLIAWFALQRPLAGDWARAAFERRLLARLRGGLFEHGWTRNLALARPDRTSCDLWAGIHRGSLLAPAAAAAPAPSQAAAGMRVRLDLGELVGIPLDERCPLDDATGRIVPGRPSGLWTA